MCLPLRCKLNHRAHAPLPRKISARRMAVPAIDLLLPRNKRARTFNGWLCFGTPGTKDNGRIPQARVPMSQQ